MPTTDDDPVGAVGVRVADHGAFVGARARVHRTVARLTAGPFGLGERDSPAFLRGDTPSHRTLVDRWAGPMAFQLAAIVLVIDAIGPATRTERIAGVAAAGGAIAYGLVILIWGRRLPIIALDVTMPVAAFLVIICGVWGGELQYAAPTLAVVIGTCLYAQRPWRVGVLMTGFLGVGYAVVLAATDQGPAPVSRWVIVMTAIVSSGAFVHWLRSKTLEFVEAEHAVRTRAEAGAAELAELSRAKTDFLSRMSHELRTPLNAVLGFTSILLDRKAGPLTDLQEEYLGDVKTAGVHLMELVGDVLDVAQVEAGQPELELSPFVIGPTVDDCVRMVRERAARGGVSVSAHVDRAVPVIQADGRKIRQALLNLVANAVRFTPPGGSVEIDARALGDQVLVSVRDTGIGIALEDQERMFDRFEQAGTEGGGTGLGLALARRFVAQHGGILTVSSAPGEGSTFTISLPARPATEPVAAHHHMAARPAAAEANSERYEGLMVRGSPANRAMVAGLGRTLALASAGVAVVLAVITPGDLGLRLGVGVVAAVAVLFVLGLDRFAVAGSTAQLDLLCLLGTITISGLVYFSGSFDALTPLAYGWLICVAFAPWARSRRVLEIAEVSVGYAVVLALRAGPGSEVDRWISIIGVFLVNGFVIRNLVGKLQVMMFAEREARRTAEGIEEELAAATAHKDDFVASMSHELRTPLNAIIGFSEVVQSGTAGPLDERQRGYLDDVVAAGRQLLVLIDDILELAKLDAGRVQLVPEVVDLVELLDRAVADHAAIASARDLRLTVATPGGIVPVLVDTLLMEHAVSRLVAKSVQSAPEGSTVSLEVEQVNGLVVLVVTDAAPISLTEREHVFDSPDEWDEREGSGLTYAIARRIVALHDGALNQRPVPSGNRIELALPAANATLAGALDGAAVPG